MHKRNSGKIFAGALAIFVLIAAGLFATARGNAISSRSSASPRNAPSVPKPQLPQPAARLSFAALPLTFEANRGQTDSRVKYLARGDGYTLFLTPDGATFALRSSTPASSGPSPTGGFA